MNIKLIKKRLKEIVDNNGSKSFARILTCTYPDLLEEVKKLTSKYNPVNINEMIYIILKSPPTLCKNNVYPKFNTYELGYKPGCGRGCVCTKESQATKLSEWHKSLTVEEKQQLINNAISTSIKKYGTTTPVKSDIVKNKIKQTNLEKYGVESPFASDIVKDKIKQTNIKKYGAETPLLNPQIQEKCRQTTIDRYGGLMTRAREGAYEKYNGLNPFQSDDVKAKINQTNIEKYGATRPLSNVQVYTDMLTSNIQKYGRPNVMQLHIPNETWDILNDKIKFEKVVTGKTSQQIKDELNLLTTTDAIKWVRRHALLDKILFKPNSAMEHDLSCWLDSNNISYQTHNRSILPNNLELDFYFPQWNLAVELHGLYHHAEMSGGKDKTYHQQKYKGCQIKNIQLLQIWQDEYWNHKNVVYSKILYLANLITKKIPARKCKLSVLTDVNLERDFMNANHIQGFADYRQLSLGAWYNDELVGVMSFANQMNRLELVRYATKIDSVASGLFSKMLKKSIEEFNFSGTIISLSDNRISNGRMYLNSGFTYVEESTPSYCYTTDYATRINKQQCMKSKLIKRHNLDPKVAERYTEWEMAQELGYDRIWDAGKIKWKYDIR